MRRILIQTLAGESSPPSDQDLLERYRRTRDEAAFELLVRRHAFLVSGVCSRILLDPHLAEDASQATFLILARKAASLRGTNVAGWLFRVARRVALRARRTADRRRERESALVADPPAPDVIHPVERAEALSLLDEEIARLPERFRLPILLCCLGGSTTEDAARTLGCPRGTILSRLSAAREKLAAGLARRGFLIPLSVLLIEAARPSNIAAFAPFPLNRTAPQLLAQGVLQSMKATKLVFASGILLVAAGLTGFGLHIGVGEEPMPVAASQPVAAKPEPEKATANQELAEKRLRENEARRLDDLVEKFSAEIAAKERALQITAEVSGPTAAALDNELARLDSEIAKSRFEVQEAEVRLALLKKKLAAGLPPPPAKEIDAAANSNSRVTAMVARITELSAQIEDTVRNGGGGTPHHLDLKEKKLALEKDLASLRPIAREETSAMLQKIMETQIKNRIAENEDELEVKTAVLAARMKFRDEFAKTAIAARKAEASRKALDRELEPQREALNRLIAARLQLTINDRDLPQNTTDQKLDAVLKELRELRNEVKQLRQGK